MDEMEETTADSAEALREKELFNAALEFRKIIAYGPLDAAAHFGPDFDLDAAVESATERFDAALEAHPLWKEECLPSSTPTPRSVEDRAVAILEEIELLCDAATAEHGPKKMVVGFDDVKPILIKHLTLAARVPESVAECASQINATCIDVAEMTFNAPKATALIASLVDAETQKRNKVIENYSQMHGDVCLEIEKLKAALAQVVADEREACAKVAESGDHQRIKRTVAAAIRARSDRSET